MMGKENAMYTPAFHWIGRTLLGASVIALAGLAAAGCGDQLVPGPSQAPPVATAQLSPPVAADAGYRTAVERQVSTSLRMTTEQVRSRLQSDPNATLMTLGKPTGHDLGQMARIVEDALDGSADAAANSGSWSAQQAGEEKRYWAAQSKWDLIAEVSRWFRLG
jgi:hypothetical protein